MTEYFIQAFIYLLAAVIAVPLAKRFGLGSVLGYLIAGVVIGPVTGLVGDEAATIQHFAEFGVVMMLFLVGLELEPQVLWQMRSRLLGLGGLQVVLTALLIMAIPMAFGLSWKITLTVGLIFSLSSTAIVLQTFSEKGLSKTDGAKSAFSILLFQDIAVIPMLAFIPMLAITGATEPAATSAEASHDAFTLVGHLPGWLYAVVVIGSIGGLVLAGHFLSRPLFRYIAETGVREIFVACALLLVVGIATLMSLIGLSPALGTFLAGVVLANSEFRHELETNIEPFKGLLLGLFFITVGAGVNFSVLIDHLGLIVGITLGVIAVKVLVLYGLATLFRARGSDRWLIALSLAQAGEFGFVLLSFTVQQNVLESSLAQMLQMVVALSMFLTPLLFIIFEKVILPRHEVKSNSREADPIDEQGQVIIAGIGRFGQIVNRLLTANGISTVVLDHEASQVDNMRALGIKSYFGDATRSDLLHTAGIENTRLFVIAIDNKDEAVSLVRYVKANYPQVKVLARAFDRVHMYQLRLAGADFIRVETYLSALELGGQALVDLGFHPFDVENKKGSFRKIDAAASDVLYEEWRSVSEGERFGTNAYQLFKEFEEKIATEMRGDRNDRHTDGERSWMPPPKGCYTTEPDKAAD
ncbi:monovalent cation:proton antiporter-2 (CPA2) family protein [Pokkaliibacter sp. MBI-7]|uniref:monovalent cation:proton antiporter-2 (CPA2) family protein n=1 Tax=Pokkaliibacter sp. MBI-7 TaxID=3040600 RepID=UPI00244D7766|nr:monovalent cation:proton antiporter-2 (CPA2) family protein [Pokkaliibacter sp. MBI-7]MDH2435296.1 monovalent cation:proton antiporter-2 (CPA2) family protein [Pokkaliibacter sp. MBI-7]